MFSILKKNTRQNNDKYELTKSVKLVDIKGYLQKEYDRANERENKIFELEKQVEELTEIQIKYDAMLVVQQETQKRIDKQDITISNLREKLKEKTDELKLCNSKKIDIKVNSENQLKKKDDEIKELKKELKKFQKTKNK